MKSKRKRIPEIQARLEQFDEIIDGLKQRVNEEKYADSASKKRLEELIHKRNEMHEKLQALEQSEQDDSDKGAWDAIKSELDDFMKDMDKDHRGSLSFYK
jgi:predicted ribosome quality control (RQC) complex YloA/Tae2 family protein